MTSLGSGVLGTEYPAAPLVGRNTADFPVRVEEILLPSPQLRLVSAVPAPPVDIAPGDSMVITLAFTPDVPAMKEDSILLRYSAPCETTLPVHVQYDGQGDILLFDVIAGDASGAPDDTVAIPLLLTRDITGLNIREWDATLSFNGSMLYPVDVIGEGTLSAAMQLTHDWDAAAGRVTVHADGGRLDGDGDLLAYVRCLVLIGDDSTTALRPADADFRHPALQVERYRDGRFTLTGYCLADGTRLVGRSGGLLLAPPTPHPVSTTATVRYTLPFDGEHALVLYDAQGREAATVAEGSAPAGAHTATFDCADLPAGTYILVLRSGNAVVTERMTVLR